MFNSPPRVQSRAQGGGFWYKVCTLHIFASHRGKFDINLGEGASSPQVSLSWPTGLLPPLDYTVSNSRFHAKRLPLCPLFHRCGWSSFSCFFFFFLVPGEICKGWVLGLARRQVYYGRFERVYEESCVCTVDL